VRYWGVRRRNIREAGNFHYCLEETSEILKRSDLWFNMTTGRELWSFISALIFKEWNCGQKLKPDLSGLASLSRLGFSASFSCNIYIQIHWRNCCSRCVLVEVRLVFKGEILPHFTVSKHECHITHIVHKTVYICVSSVI